MTARLFGDLYAAEHSRHFTDTRFLREPLDAGKSSAILDFFFHFKMGVRQRGDLRQVRHANYLMVRRYLLEFFTDDFGDPPANTGVDLVKEQSYNFV